MASVITVRVEEDLKRKIKRYSIPVSQVARTAIVREIERREREEALRAIRRMKKVLRGLDTKRLVRNIRKDRLRA